MTWVQILAGFISIVDKVVELITLNKYKKAGRDEQVVEQMGEESKRRKEAIAALSPDNLDRVRDKYSRD